MLSEAVFQPQKGSITLKKPFFCRYLFAKLCFCEEIYVSHLLYICKENRLLHVKQRPTKANKTGYYRPTGLYSKPVGAKEAYELRRHFHHTGGIQKQHLPQPTKWRSKKNGKAARLRTLRLAGELDSHGYRHNPEHTGKRLALFPLISKRSFLCNLIVAHLLGWVWRCLFANTGQQSGEPIVVCSPTLKALKRAVCARRFSRQTPVASTGARALKKHGTGCFMDSYTATAVCLRLRYLYMYMVCCCAKTL